MRPEQGTTERGIERSTKRFVDRAIYESSMTEMRTVEPARNGALPLWEPQLDDSLRLAPDPASLTV